MTLGIFHRLLLPSTKGEIDSLTGPFLIFFSHPQNQISPFSIESSIKIIRKNFLK
jgi:hypothetical protein